MKLFVKYENDPMGVILNEQGEIEEVRAEEVRAEEVRAENTCFPVSLPVTGPAAHLLPYDGVEILAEFKVRIVS